MRSSNSYLRNLRDLRETNNGDGVWDDLPRISQMGGAVGSDEDVASPAAWGGGSFNMSEIEDEYANTATQTVPWRSTETRLICDAYGGETGGVVRVGIAGADDLVQYGGQPLPLSRELAAEEVFCFTNTYRAITPSSGEDAIQATGTFIEHGTGWFETSIDRATAVQVEVEPVVEREGCPNRHLLGVREWGRFNIHPTDIQKTITINEDWNYNSEIGYQCPLTAANDGVTITTKGSIYTPHLQIIEPAGVVCNGGESVGYEGSFGKAGYVGMKLDLYITPLTVSFTGLSFMEMPDDNGTRSGYFLDSYFTSAQTHNVQNKAGRIRKINPDNFFLPDLAAFETECPPPWSDGTVETLLGRPLRTEKELREFLNYESADSKKSKYGYAH